MAHFEDKATIVAKGAINVQVLAGHMGVYYFLNLRVTFQKTTWKEVDYLKAALLRQCYVSASEVKQGYAQENKHLPFEFGLVRFSKICVRRAILFNRPEVRRGVV